MCNVQLRKGSALTHFKIDAVGVPIIANCELMIANYQNGDSMTVSELSNICNFEPIALPDGDRDVSGCYIGDLLSWVMGRAKADCAWITIMSNINIVAVAALADVACIILSEGVTVDESVKTTAESKGVNILMSKMPSYETAKTISDKV